ncbi:hypothetical protein Tco_1236202 [Tanacetum coccineum]
MGVCEAEVDFIKIIQDKCYNIHQDLRSVSEKLNEGLSLYPDCKKLNKFLKRFEEDFSKKDLARKDENDDTTGIDKDKNDLPYSDKSGNFDFQSMKNEERNDADVESVTNFEVGGKREAKNGNEASSQMDQDSVHPSLNEDDKVGDSSHATGVDCIIEGDAVELTEFEDVDINEKVEKEKQQIGNEESSSQMDQDSVNPSLNEDDKVGHSSHATGVDSVIKEDVDINEKVEKEKEEIGNEESNSQMDHVSIKTSLNEDDKVVDDSVTTIPDSVTEGTREKLIKNDNVLVDDVLHPIANVQDSVERSEHSLEKEKNKISNEKFRSQSLKDNVGAEAINDNVKDCNLVAGDSQHTLEDKTKEGKFN